MKLLKNIHLLKGMAEKDLAMMEHAALEHSRHSNIVGNYILLLTNFIMKYVLILLALFYSISSKSQIPNVCEACITHSREFNCKCWCHSIKQEQDSSLGQNVFSSGGIIMEEDLDQDQNTNWLYYYFIEDSLGYEILINSKDTPILRLPVGDYGKQIQFLIKDTTLAIKYLSHLYNYQRFRASELWDIIGKRNAEIEDYKNRMKRISKMCDQLLINLNKTERNNNKALNNLKKQKK